MSSDDALIIHHIGSSNSIQHVGSNNSLQNLNVTNLNVNAKSYHTSNAQSMHTTPPTNITKQQQRPQYSSISSIITTPNVKNDNISISPPNELIYQQLIPNQLTSNQQSILNQKPASKQS